MLPRIVECRAWLEDFVKRNQPIEPKAVYVAGSAKGFSRTEIKAARRWFGNYIETDDPEGRARWRWVR